MKTPICIFTLCLAIHTVNAFALLPEGTQAPDFRIMDGNEKWLDSKTLMGKVVVGFYNDKSAADKNNELRDKLNGFWQKHDSIAQLSSFKLAVTDASQANITTKWIWRRVMRNKSKTLGIPLYGDWDGSMKKDFGIPDGESTFFIFDKKGVIRYLRSGTIPASEHGRIMLLIKQLTTQ